MRIRKRPPSSSSSSLPLSPDPPLHVLHPPNGKRHGAKDSTSGGGGGGGGGGLHPVGDLPPLIDPHTSPILDPPLSDPYLDEDGGGGSRGSPLLATDQASKEVKEEEEAWRTTVEYSDRIKWNAQAISSNRRSGSSGAVVIGREMISLHKKTKGGNEHNGYGGDGGSETNKLMQQEKKAKVQKARASTTSGPASANNNCTKSTAKDGDKELGYCNGGAAGVRAGNIGLSATANGKRRRSPAVLMEGSRCSRVNGRGWRCCQQTLVGYSLCEHHLGKGRLRSMSSVKGQLGTSKPKWSTDGRNGVVPSVSVPPSQVDAVDREKGKQSPQPYVAANNGVEKIDEEEEEEEEEEEMARKKRKKIGMVKARSISSLLDDTNHPPTLLPSQPRTEVALMSPPDRENKAK